MLTRLLLIAGLLAGPAAAQSILSKGGSYAETAFLPGTAGPDGLRTAGIEIRLAPGWKTYWRSPGGAGIPPQFDWTGSRNLASAEILWPRPTRFESFGLDTVGYAGRVVLPVRLVPVDPGLPIGIALELRLGVCAEICLIELVRFEEHLVPSRSEGAVAVAAALATVPPEGVDAECRLAPGGAGGERRRLEARLTLAAPTAAPSVILEGPPGAWFENAETVAEGTALAVSADLVAPDMPWIARDAIRFTVLGDDGFAADIRCG